MQILQDFLSGTSMARLGHHVGIFFLHRIMVLAFPLLLLPLLAHRLLQDAMGNFFVLQAWGLALSYIIDYGFTARGARAMAKADSDEARNQEIGKIISAQLLLSLAILPLWLLTQNFLPVLANSPLGANLALLLGVTTAITPNWYFLGMQRLKGFVTIDLLFRIVVLGMIWLLPYAENDFVMPYIVIALGQAIVCLAAIFLLLKYNQFRLSPLNQAIGILKNNWKLMVSEIGLLIPVSFNTILLSLFAIPALIAIYGVAEKIIRGCAALLIALVQALYPHFTQLQKEKAMGIRTLLAWGLISNGILTFTASIGVVLFGPIVIRYLAKGDPAFALTLTYWQIPVLFLFGLQSTIYMHGLLARHDDVGALRATMCGSLAYAAIGVASFVYQSVYLVIAAQGISLLVMTIASILLPQKKNPAV